MKETTEPVKVEKSAPSDKVDVYGLILILCFVILSNFAAFDLGRQVQKDNSAPSKIPTVEFSFRGDKFYLENGRGLDRVMMYDFELYNEKNGSVSGRAKYDTLKIRIIK